METKIFVVIFSLSLILSGLTIVGFETTIGKETSQEDGEWYYMYEDEHRASADGSIGYPDTVWEAGIRIELPAGELKKIAYFDYDIAEYVQGYVYTDESGNVGKEIGHTEKYNTTGDSVWVELSLNNSIEIHGGHYWVVLEIDDYSDEFYPVGYLHGYVDDGGYIREKGYEWETLPDNGWDYSWALEAYVDSAPEPDYIDIEPKGRTALTNESIEYKATSYDRFGRELEDVTQSTEFRIEEEDHTEYWEDNFYIPERAGEWTVNASYEFEGEYYYADTSVTVETEALQDVLEWVDDLQRRVDDLENRVGDVDYLQEEVGDLQEEIEYIYAEISELEQNVSKLQQNLTETEEDITELEQDITELEQRVDDLETKQKKQGDDIESLRLLVYGNIVVLVLALASVGYIWYKLYEKEN